MWLTRAYIGLLYKATVLQTWGTDSLPLGPGRTYAGLELGMPVAQVGLGLGLLYRVDDDGGDTGRWLVTGGVGWGF